MRLYHGSTIVVDSPKVITPNRPLDFGKGFYLNHYNIKLKDGLLQSLKLKNNYL